MTEKQTNRAALVAEYQAFLAANPDCPALSADESLHEIMVEYTRRETRARELCAYLANYIERWNANEFD